MVSDTELDGKGTLSASVAQLCREVHYCMYCRRYRFERGYEVFRRDDVATSTLLVKLRERKLS